MTPSRPSGLSPTLCRRLAFGAWTLLGGLYVVGQYALVGWIGPAPVFLAWSVAAAPSLLLTGYWLRQQTGRMPRRLLTFAAAVWLPFLIVALAVPTVELGGWVAWAGFLGMLLSPLVFTFLALASVEESAKLPGLPR